MPELQKSEMQVTYKPQPNLNIPPNVRHKFVDITLNDYPSDVLPIEFPQLGVQRLMHLVPHPIGQHFSAVWDGNSAKPTLFLEGDTEGPITIRLEIWGV